MKLGWGGLPHIARRRAILTLLFATTASAAFFLLQRSPVGELQAAEESKVVAELARAVRGGSPVALFTLRVIDIQLVIRQNIAKISENCPNWPFLAKIWPYQVNFSRPRHVAGQDPQLAPFQGLFPTNWGMSTTLRSHYITCG
jgi:hypothetical protein